MGGFFFAQAANFQTALDTRSIQDSWQARLLEGCSGSFCLRRMSVYSKYLGFFYILHQL